MYVCKRDVIDCGDRDCIGDCTGGESKQFPRTCRCRDCELGGVVETPCHYGHGGCESTLDFIRYCECQHESLAGCSDVFGRCKDRPKIVTRMAKAARCHIAIEKVDIAHKRRVEECRLVGRGLAAANQRATTRGSIFFDLVAQQSERRSRNSCDRARYAVENVAFEKLPNLGCQVFRSGGNRKGADPFNGRVCFCLPLRCNEFSHTSHINLSLS